MKKRFLMVLMLLINLNIVLAQEALEEVLGMDINTLLVILPILMVGVGALFFAVIFLKDNLPKIMPTAQKKLKTKEKQFLKEVKDIGNFFTKKEEELEKTIKETQKQWFNKLQNLTKVKPKPTLPPPKIKPHTPQVVPKPPVKKYIGIKQLFRKLLKPKPTAIHVKKPIDPSPPPKIKPVIKKDKSILTKDTEKLLDYLKKKEKEGLYQLKEEGKKFLDKIESQLQKIKNNTQKELKEKEKEFLDSVKPFVKTKGEDIHPTEEEKRMLSFVEQMKEQNMVHIEKRRLEREKRKLKGPLPDSLKPKLRMKNMQNLAEEEQKIMGKIHKMSDKFPDIQHIKPKKKQKKYDYEWESKADEIKQKRTKKMDELLKEEEKILSKLNKL